MQRLDQLKNLIVMAVADGSLGEHELTLLSERCEELGLSEQDLRAAIRFALSDDAALQLPREPEAQESLLSDLIRMMAADGRLTESEKRLFALAAAKMEISDERLNHLIDTLVR